MMNEGLNHNICERIRSQEEDEEIPFLSPKNASRS